MTFKLFYTVATSSPPPVFFDNPAAAVSALQTRVTGLLRGRSGLRALEAGAGKRTRLDLPADAYVVGVDTDEVALSRNERLDERVLTDLAAHTAPEGAFDLVTCWYVLEHVPDPATLLDRFAHWVAPGGLVALAVPNLRSPKSLITKLTPHRFHVWFRRRVLGFPNAGKPGHGPYPTTLRRAISPAALASRAARHGLEVAFEGYFEDTKQVTFRRRLHLTGLPWKLLCALTYLLTLGLLDPRRTELLLLLRRPVVIRTPVPASAASSPTGAGRG